MKAIQESRRIFHALEIKPWQAKKWLTWTTICNNIFAYSVCSRSDCCSKSNKSTKSCVYTIAKCILLSELFQQAKYLSQMVQTSWKPGSERVPHCNNSYSYSNSTFYLTESILLNSTDYDWTKLNLTETYWTQMNLTESYWTFWTRLNLAEPDYTRLMLA